MARRRRSPLKKALHAMAPHRVLWRALSGPEIKSALRTKTTRVTAQTRQQQATAAQRKTATAKKAAGRRSDPYAAALAIPGQNRAAAAKAAAATGSAAKKTMAVRKRNGQFDGSKVMTTADHAAYQRAQSGYVDPSLLPRTPRRRSQRGGT